MSDFANACSTSQEVQLVGGICCGFCFALASDDKRSTVSSPESTCFTARINASAGQRFCGFFQERSKKR